MAEPVFSPTLERLYRRLPEYIRVADPATDYATKRYLSLVGDVLGDLEVLLDRVDYVTVADGGAVGDSSDLVDPAKADLAWLPWLAQLVSVRAGDLNIGALRAAIAHPSTGWEVCSQNAVLAAVQPNLTGGKHVTIERSYLADPFRVRISTYAGETPTISLGDLAQRFGSLAAVTAAYPTIGSMPNASSAIAAALELQRPAHVQFDFTVAAGGPIGALLDDYVTLGALFAALPTLEAVRTHIPGS